MAAMWKKSAKSKRTAMGKVVQPGNDHGEEDFDYLLVLGYKLDHDKPSDILLERLRTACLLHKRYPDAPIILSGGICKDNGISEARAMQQYLLTRGIPEKLMILEEQSRDTYENLVNCGRIIRRGGADAHIAVITSSYHMRRTAACVHKLGLSHITPVPAKTPLAKAPGAYIWEVFCFLDFIRKGYL